MEIVWYVLIHVSLGLIGYEVFLFNNLGSLYATAAGAVVQGWAIWEIYRVTRPKFDAAFVGTPGSEKHRNRLREFWKRLARLFIFRLSAFTILTLLVAWLTRGVGG